MRILYVTVQITPYKQTPPVLQASFFSRSNIFTLLSVTADHSLLRFPVYVRFDKAALNPLRFVTGCKRHVLWTKALHTNLSLAVCFFGFFQAAARCGQHVPKYVLSSSHSSTHCCFSLPNACPHALHLIGCCDRPGQLALIKRHTCGG